MPLPDPDAFALVAAAEREFSAIRAELDRLAVEAFMPWPLCAAYAGSWLVFPLHLRSYPPSLKVDFAAHRRLCPRTAEFVLDHPKIASAAFSRLEPGCHIYPHTDHPMPGIVRSHLALDVPGGSALRVLDEHYGWTEGKGLVFDGCVQHEAANLGRLPRTVMLLDFELTDSERAEVARVATFQTPTWCESCTV